MHATTILVLLIAHKSVVGLPYYVNPNYSGSINTGYLYNVVYECPRDYRWNVFTEQCEMVKLKTTTTPPSYYYPYENSVTGNDPDPPYVSYGITSGYYKSRNDGPAKMQRKKGITFNPDTNRCENHQPVRQRPHVPYLAPKLQTTMPTGGNTPHGCPDHVDPYNPVHLPHPDCAKYYKCTTSGPEEWHCPDGLHWSRALNRCDHYWRAGCAGGGSKDLSMVTSTASPVITTATTTSTARTTAASTKVSSTTGATLSRFGGLVDETTESEDFYTTDAVIANDL
ncbi:uncharacterized protein LOC109415766 [Aedes albopictus]|uniref:Chitin-binding type-2 domain-containing protein n=1 Tax=Aedes albopictus TaxID=7160 RepID=A0ABM1YGK9_AEDAL|nr:uncharacterized protein LOC109428156 [Aedes albopictus]